MNADLRPGNIKAAKLTGATLLREFLAQRVAPLQVHSRPLWMLRGADDDLRVNSAALADEELVAALRLLVGDDVEGLEGAPAPLFLRDNWQQVVDAMPTFDGPGLVPAVPPVAQEATAPVEVSSGDSRGGGEEDEEEEERNSEATTKGTKRPPPA